MIKHKNLIRKRWQTNTQAADRVLLLDIAKVIKSEIAQFRNENWRRTLEAVNVRDNSVWRVVRRFKNPYSELPTLKYNDRVCLTDDQKGAAFGEYFQDNFTNNLINSQKQNEITQYCEDIKNMETQSVPPESLTTPKEVAEIIKRSPTSRAPGPDGIPNILIKKFTKKA